MLLWGLCVPSLMSGDNEYLFKRQLILMLPFKAFSTKNLSFSFSGDCIFNQDSSSNCIISCILELSKNVLFATNMNIISIYKKA